MTLPSEKEENLELNRIWWMIEGCTIGGDFVDLRNSFVLDVLASFDLERAKILFGWEFDSDNHIESFMPIHQKVFRQT